MSMYSIMHGKNPDADILLTILDFDQPEGQWPTGRFRDIYPNADGSEIILYTRNGGGNREHRDNRVGIIEGEECLCTACIINHHLPKHPNYLRDWDDDFDSTYAYVAFSVPKEYQDIVKGLSTGEDPKTVHEKHETTMAEMEAMTKEDLLSDPRFAPIVKIVNQMAEDIKKGKSGKTYKI